MIKLKGVMDNREQLMLGLSEGNLQRLREGKPIHIFGAEWEVPFDLVIFWGETEQKLAEMVKPFLGPNTRIRDMLSDRPKKS